MCEARRLMHDSLRGSAPQRLALWMVVLVAVIAGGVTGATTASVATFAYDGPAVERVHVDGFEAVEDRPAQLGYSQEGSGSVQSVMVTAAV